MTPQRILVGDCRAGVGIELDPKAAAMAERRVRGDAPLFARVTGGAP